MIPEEITDIGVAADKARIAHDSIRDQARVLTTVFDPEKEKHYLLERYIIENLDRAIEQRWIKVYYQPIVRTVSHQACGLEALARWVDPDKGIISPGQLIPILERYHLCGKLDLYMVDQVCREFGVRTNSGLYPLPISVNLARIDFEYEDMAGRICEIVDTYGLDHRLLQVEITESAFLGDQQLLKKQIDKLHDYGFEVWLDDFGSGYSSLSELPEYKFDTVKLDMKFMQELYSEPNAIILVEQLIKMATSFGMHTLVEGVETSDQLNFLRRIGCDKIQGYIVEKPQPLQYYLMINSQPGAIYPLEKAEERAYYDNIGLTSLIRPSMPEAARCLPQFLDGQIASVYEVMDGRLRCLKGSEGYWKCMKMMDLRQLIQVKDQNGFFYELRVENWAKSKIHELEQTNDWICIQESINAKAKMMSFARKIGTNPLTGAWAFLVISAVWGS